MTNAAMATETKASQLESILATHCSKANSLKYRERKAKTDPKAITEKAGMLKEVQEQFGKLTLPKLVTITALGKHFDKQTGWRIDRDEWISANSKRFQNMCYDCNQALGKKPRSQWVVEIFGEASKASNGGAKVKQEARDSDDGDAAEGDQEDQEDGEEDGEEAEEEEEEQEQEEEVETETKKRPARGVKTLAIVGNQPKYFHGWCEETEKAWRSRVDDTTRAKEWCNNDPFIRKGSKDTDSSFVSWPGEEAVALCGLNVGDWRAKQAARGSKGCVGLLDGAEVCVRVLADRGAIVVILVGSSQKCQVKSDVFLSPAAAEGFMLQLAKDIIIGDVGIENVYQVRDDRLADMGLGPRVNRDAAASAKPKAKAKGKADKTPKVGSAGKGNAAKKRKLNTDTAKDDSKPSLDLEVDIGAANESDFDCNDGMDAPPPSMEMEIDDFEGTLKY